MSSIDLIIFISIPLKFLVYLTRLSVFYYLPRTGTGSRRYVTPLVGSLALAFYYCAIDVNGQSPTVYELSVQKNRLQVISVARWP